MIFRSLFILTWCVFTTSVSAANLEQDVSHCAQIEDAMSRLSCYDELFASVKTLKKEQSSKAVAKFVDKARLVARQSTPVIQQTSVSKQAKEPAFTQTKRDDDDSFGREQIKKKVNIESPDKIIFTIAKLKKYKRGRWEITFENGQKWKQTDTGLLLLNVGARVRLKKGLFGGISLNKLNYNKSIKVKRLR